MLSLLRHARWTLSLGFLALLASNTAAQGKIEYNRDVRPILTENCFQCHGPAAKKGGVRLDSREDATKPGKRGTTPIVAGKLDMSEMVQRIFTTVGGEMMPPPSSHKKLTAAQKETLKQWIAQGAEYQKHWSFEAPVKIATPKVPGLLSSNPIDGFIADRLKREGLALSPEADRATLIRRASFALTGLPPTPADVDAFATDKSPTAYEKMVDRYLGSKHFGEEMARHWLDLARYADTHGLHLDNERQMWLYRDWVVKSFNDNLPFNQFTIQQLAGDLLPNPTRAQLIATGFNRCNVSTSEGGSIDSEWVFRYAVDRTSTMTEAWLGLTGGCAVCHDHKFDPISAKEFYSLYAFFYSASGPAMDGNALTTDPFLKAPSPQQEKRLAELNLLITKSQQELADKLKAATYVDPNDGPDPKFVNDPARSFRDWVLQARDAKDNKAIPKDLLPLLKLPKLEGTNEKKLRDHYLQNVLAETKAIFEPIAKKTTELTKERDSLNTAIPGTFIFKELGQPRDSHVMVRGQYDKPGEKVEPGTLAALPPLKKSDAKGRATRLDLANWLVSPENPLTARVTVNRFWQQFLGVGLVKSSADFGAQGDSPTHPELLDMLAVSFRESGWDVKALVKQIVMSSTFRQSSRLTPELWKRDPEDRLHARGPRLRLDAEQIRDNALFAGGLINLEMGGKGVRPYQPTRIWEPVAFSGSNTGNYTQDKGGALYRRSLYTFLKRTAPAPFMANFDAPNREALCSRRERSNTPLQALQLMNDVQHFEAARALAQRMLVEGGATPADRVRFAYRVVLSRPPEPMELELVQRTLQQHLERYAKDHAAAQKAVRVGESLPRPGLSEPELAAYTLIANLLLNLDETVMRN